ncbi:hydroxyisourate hydrolase [Vibrio sp. SM6]|uniref:5-hydroxyisourate hydrolase n=1 Tax=Vibrio agarilyticus TaxID=2726741 RepID=A0A7X8TTQ0_9VIBR|nr:hydroxyisourate hydrolase [Vibrio agarilyticus]NLS14631.1 hydroxyisourate hydrolase [Vibrio agarilyticus]
MSQLSCHILDTANGQPAAGVPVSLHRYPPAQSSHDALATPTVNTAIEHATTDNDGRARFSARLTQGESYTLRFASADYCLRHFNQVFFPLIEVHFCADDPRHYHIPVLLSPYSYTTYRGS